MSTCRRRPLDEKAALDHLTLVLPEEDPAHLRRLVCFRSPLLAVLGHHRSPFDLLRWIAYVASRRIALGVPL